MGMRVVKVEIHMALVKVPPGTFMEEEFRAVLETVI